jgi:hypothetical protein
MQKRIRILANGTIADADRRMHTTRDPAKGGADTVDWDAVGGGSFTISFRYLKGSPFAAGHGPNNPHNINVPKDPPQPVTRDPGTYKYDVYRNDNAGNPIQPPTDDPDVIIDS